MKKNTGNKKTGMTRQLNKFSEWAASMNYSPETIKKREVSINRFIGWCEKRDLTKSNDITRQILESYRRYLFTYRKPDGAPLSFTTQHSMLAPLKAFFKWLARENYILFNPASEFDLPKLPKRLPKYILSTEEINDMLNHTSIYGDLGIRDAAIIDSFYSTGVRRMELVNLKIHDVDFVRGTVVIFEGKGQKDRAIPIGDRACARLRKYMEDVRPQLIRGEDNGYIFLTEEGKPFAKNRMVDLINKYKKAVGIDKPGVCHLFRSAMATHMLDNGASLRYIQKMLGHANLSSTEIYTHVSIKKLKDVHSATHPAKLIHKNEFNPLSPLD